MTHPLMNANPLSLDTSCDVSPQTNAVLSGMRMAGMPGKRLFHGNIELIRGSNGIVLLLGGEMHIARDGVEVMEILSARIAAATLER